MAGLNPTNWKEKRKLVIAKIRSNNSWRERRGTYVGDWHSKEALPVVVGEGELLALLQVLVDTPHLVGVLVATLDLRVELHGTHLHLQHVRESVLRLGRVKAKRE